MPTRQQHPNIDTAMRYHQAVARWASSEELAEFLHEDVKHREFPNALFPDGVVRDRDAMLAASERGRATLAHQQFEVLNAVAVGDQVAMEVFWTGTFTAAFAAAPWGESVLYAHIATFLEFRDGKIVAQRNYDCYERGPRD
ncbi:nuclear transport factor 2 family protein [Streptomyces sp. NPDC002537]